MSAKNSRIFTMTAIIFCFVFFGTGLLSAEETDDIKTHLQTVLSDPNAAGYLPREVTLDCINGSRLQLNREEETLFVLLWNSEDPNAAEFKAFSNLFFAGFDNPKARFLGINLDEISKKKEIVAELLKNPCLWAQIVAAEPANKMLESFVPAGIKKANLVIIAPQGQVEYVGSAVGLEPQEILGRLSAVTENTEKTEEPEIAILYRKESIEVSEEEFNPQAEKLLENARMFFRIGNRMTAAKSYGQPIRMCRQIIKDYPNTKYANEARLLMRQVPERYRQRYEITDEELGL